MPVYPKRKLGDVLRVSIDAVDVDPSRTYLFAGVYSFGRGLFERGELSGAKTTYKKFHRLHEGMFVMSQPKGWEGALARVTKSFDGFFLSPVYPTFLPDPKQLNVRYLEWYFRQKPTWDTLVRLSKGMGARRNSVYPNMLLSLEIPLPPLSEQRRIVAKIEHLAARLEEAKTIRIKSNATIIRLQKSLFQNAEKNALRFGISKTIASVIKSHDSGWSPRCLDTPAPKGDWGVLKTTAVQLNKFVPCENKAIGTNLEPKIEKIVSDGDVLITRAGPANRVGIPCVVRNPPERLMLSDKIIRLVPSSEIYPEFLALMLASPSAQEHCRQGKTGLAVSQVNITREKLLAIEIPIPPVKEQRRIVDALTCIQKKTDDLKALQAKTAAELDAILPSILDRAFRGEL